MKKEKIENNCNTEKEEKKKKGLIIIIIILLLLLFMLLGCFIGCHLCNDKYPDKDVGGVHLEIDSDAGEYKEPDKDESDSTGVAIPGWGKITIPENQTEVDVNFYNPSENEGKYYLTFELQIPGKNGKYETIYKSGLVKPGLYIQKITLTKGLQSGVYDAVIRVQPYRMDENKTPTNNADMETELIVI